MPRVFSKHNSENLSSKDYIERKRNIRIYNDYSDNVSPEKKIAHHKNNKLTHANNHSNLLKLTKGYYEHHQKCNDENFFTTYPGENFTYNFKNCSLRGVTEETMNYEQLIGEYNVISEIRDDYEPNFNFERDYAKVGTKPFEENGQLFEIKEKIHNVKCFQFPLPDLPTN